MSPLDVSQVRSLLEQAQQGVKGQATPSPAREFSDLLAETSAQQKGAERRSRTTRCPARASCTT